MEQYKKVKVVLLPTEKETNLILDRGKLEQITNKQIVKSIKVEYFSKELADKLYIKDTGSTGSAGSGIISPKTNLEVKAVKDSWNREEVIEFGNKVREYCQNGYKNDSNHKVYFEWNEFINQNL